MSPTVTQTSPNVTNNYTKQNQTYKHLPTLARKGFGRSRGVRWRSDRPFKKKMPLRKEKIKCHMLESETTWKTIMNILECHGYISAFSVLPKAHEIYMCV